MLCKKYHYYNLSEVSFTVLVLFNVMMLDGYNLCSLVYYNIILPSTFIENNMPRKILDLMERSSR
jgi:hypothetical protein